MAVGGFLKSPHKIYGVDVKGCATLIGAPEVTSQI